MLINYHLKMWYIFQTFIVPILQNFILLNEYFNYQKKIGDYKNYLEESKPLKELNGAK